MVVEPISNVEWIGTTAVMGNTALVTARMINAPPAENAALAIDARKLPATSAIKTESISGMGHRMCKV